MLVKIGITKEARETRNLCMHGLRHLFVTLSRSAGLPDYVVMRLAGHRSPEMMERYSHGEKIVDFQAARIGIEAALSPKAASK
jgi:integrase